MNFSENITKLEALDLIKNYGAKYYKFLPNILRKDKEVLLLAIEDRWQAFIFASKDLKRDKEVILQAVKKSADALNYVKTSFKEETDFINKLIEANADSIKFVKSDAISFENVLKVAKSPNRYLHFLNEEYRKNPEIVLEAVKSNWQNIFDALVFNYEIYLNAVKGSWNILEIVPEEFRQDKEMFEIAFRQNKWAIKYFPFLLNDRKIIELLIQNNGFDYRIVDILPQWLLDDADLVRKLFINKGLVIFPYISPKLYKDKDLILFLLDMLKNASVSWSSSVTENILKIVSKHWLNDEEIMLKIMDLAFLESSIADFICKILSKQNEHSLAHKLITNKDILVKIINSPEFDYRIVQFLPAYIRDDKNLMLHFIAKKGVLVLQYVSQRLQQDRKVVLFSDLMIRRLRSSRWDYEQEYKRFMSNIILKYWSDDKEVLLNYFKLLDYCNVRIALHFYDKISPNLQQDWDIVFSLIKMVDDSERDIFYTRLPNNLRKNEDFCVKLLQIAPIVIKVFDKEMQKKYINFAIEQSIATNDWYFIFLDDMPQYRDDAYICLCAIKQNRLNMQFVSERLRDDKDFMREAIKINADNYYHTSKRLEKDEELKELARSLGCKIWNK